MNIDEAIKHAREVAEYKREMAEGVWRKKLNKPDFPWGRDYTKEEVERKEKECVLCAEEHEQLVEWLEELKDLRQLTIADEERIRADERRKVLDEVISVLADLGYGDEENGAEIDYMEALDDVTRRIKQMKGEENDEF